MNSSGDWDLEVDKAVVKELARLPRPDARRLMAVIEDLINDPYCGDLEKLKGETHVWRRRVGAYRIFFEVFQSSRLVLVFRLERRSSKTY